MCGILKEEIHGEILTVSYKSLKMKGSLIRLKLLLLLLLFFFLYISAIIMFLPF